MFYLKFVKRIVLPTDVIRFGVERNRDKTAVVDGERSITYGELYERIKKLINSLAGLKITKDDKLAILIHNCQEYYEIRAATYLTGIILVPIIWNSDPKIIISTLNVCEVKCFIYHPDILGEKIKDIIAAVKVKYFVPITKSREKGSYEDLISQGASVNPQEVIRPKEAVTDLFAFMVKVVGLVDPVRSPDQPLNV